MTTPVLDVSTGANPFETVTLTALAAGEIREVRGELGFLSLLSATNVNQVSISFTGASFFSFTNGITLQDFTANTFFVRNDDTVANTVTFAKGQAGYRDNRLILAALSALPVAMTAASSAIATGAFAAGAVSAGAIAAGAFVSGSVLAGAFATGAIVDLGLKADAAATTDAGTFSLIALTKRLLGKMYTLASSIYAVDSLGTTNAVNIKASAGSVLSISAVNTTGAIKYVRMYDKATAPSVGTDVAFRTIAIPATSSKEISFPNGDTYLLGIAIAITGAAAYNDATAVAAHDVQLSVNYQ